MDTHMISIIITTKNGSPTIERAIKSIQAQTEKDLEIIVISDATTDDTEEKIKKMATEDSRIKLISLTENVGPGKARTIAIEKSQGELIAILDDDDFWISPEKLETQKNFLLENPDHILVGSDHIRFVDEEGKLLFIFESERTDEEIKQHLLLHNPFVTSSVLFKKVAYLKAGGFSELRLAEEYELWLSMGLFGKFANLRNCEIEYTQRASGLTLSRRQKMNKIHLMLIKRHRDDYPLYTLALIKAYLRVFLTTFKLRIRSPF
jgi:glycosyltransferase involved in cell wall biosynthesis